jgi:eukaryotic-like serine/threonine-protein kinase
MVSESAPENRSRRFGKLGKYEIVAHIAVGGMGVVYRARDTETGCDVALKVLTPELACRPVLLERFRREARHASKLQHPNIVRMLDFLESDGTVFLVMEYVDGTDLHELVAREGPLTPEEARLVLMQACEALAHAAEQGIIHRDIKPSNFLLTRCNGAPFIKLTDLGLARETTLDELRLTRAGTTVGTLDYMAPEQTFDSGDADIRSDLYSLGATWFYLLTGRPPFLGTQTERLKQILRAEPPAVRALNPRVSRPAAAVLSRLLAKEPADRYQTPEELLAALRGLQGRSTFGVRRSVFGVENPKPEVTSFDPGPQMPNAEHRTEPDSFDGEHRTPNAERSSWVALAIAAALAAGVILTIALVGKEPPAKPPVPVREK